MFKGSRSQQSVVYVAGLATAGLIAAGFASPASAHPAKELHNIKGVANNNVIGHLRVSIIARGNTLSQPDEITRLGDRLYVAFQNGIHAKGQPGSNGQTNSTIVEYTMEGKRLASWNIPGHCDGLTADPYKHELVATVNEDGNSSMFTIQPQETGRSGAVTQYSYSQNPLPHGGGTDSIAFYKGQMLISASAPTVAGGPAVYSVRLSGHSAVLSPFFFDNSSATVANKGADRQKTSLALTDPDSSTVVPRQSPRFGGSYVLDSQGDQQQVYVNGTGMSQRRMVLNLSQSINDTAWATSATGTLFVTDHTNNEVVAITGTFRPGTAFVAATPSSANNPSSIPNYLGTLNLWTGNVTRVANMALQPQGLLFVPGMR